MTAHTAHTKATVAVMNPSLPPAPESPGRKAAVPEKTSPRQKQQQQQQQDTAASQQPEQPTKSQQQRVPEPVAKSTTSSSSTSSSAPSKISGSTVITGGDNNGDVIGEYVLGETIGKGTFGKVRLGLHLLTGEKVAIKILEKKRIIQVADVERVAREIKILKRNRHQNVIQLYEVIDSPERIFLIMEHIDGGEMFEYIVAHHRIREPEAAFLFRQIVDGLAYLHANEVTHRDLKPENLLLQSIHHRQQQHLDQPVSTSLLVKIVDFGLSNTHDGGRLLRTACGSPCYAAPEMIQGRLYHGPIADMWSLGVVLFAMVCGFLPFEDSNTNLLYKKILSANYKMPTFLSPNVQDLIRHILETDPEKRYDVNKIRQHPWLVDVAMPDMGEFETPESTKSDEVKARHKLILNQLEALGLPKVEVQGSLSRKAFNRFTASYFLLDGKLQRTMKNRIPSILLSNNNVAVVSGSAERPTRRDPSSAASVVSEVKRQDQTSIRASGSNVHSNGAGSISSHRKNSRVTGEPQHQNPTHEKPLDSPRRRSVPHHHTPHSQHGDDRRAVTPSAHTDVFQYPGGGVGAPHRPSSVRGGRNLVILNGSGTPTGSSFFPVAPNLRRDHRHSGILSARKSHGNTRVTVSNGMVALRPLVQPVHPPRRELQPSAPQSSARRLSTDAHRHAIAPPPTEPSSHHTITSTSGSVAIRRRPVGPHTVQTHSFHQPPVGSTSMPVTTPISASDSRTAPSVTKSDDTRSPQRIVSPTNS